MVKLTMIAHVTDGLPLAEGLDDGHDLQDAEVYKQQVKALFKNLSRGQNKASRMSIETGPYIFQYPWLLEILLPRSLILLYVQGDDRHLAVATYFLIVSHSMYILLLTCFFVCLFSCSITSETLFLLFF